MAKSKPDSRIKTPAPAPKKDESPGSENAPKKKAAKKANAQRSAKASEATAKMPAASKSESRQNGGTSQLPADQLSSRDREAIRAKLRAASFGNIVTILSQSPHHKDMPLSEIIHLVQPPLRNNQFDIVEAQYKNTGYTIPAALALWAQVSEEVDMRLVKNEDKPIQLSAEEWHSGDIIWLIEVLGDKRFVRLMLDRLNKTVFKGKSVKFRTVSTAGVASIKQLRTPEA